MLARVENFSKMAKMIKMAKTGKIADIAETQIVMFLKTFKSDGFFEKKNEFYTKSLKVTNLLQNAYQMVFFLKNVFCPIYQIFWQKIRKN